MRKQVNSIQSFEIPIPIKLKSKLENNFSGTELEKAIDIISEMIFRHQTRSILMLAYLPYDKKSKKSIIGASKFNHLWRQLEELGIIECEIINEKTYEVGKRSKHYRIKPNWFDGKVEFTDHMHKVSIIENQINPFNVSQEILTNLEKLEIPKITEKIEKKALDLASKYLKEKSFILDERKLKIKTKQKSYTYQFYSQNDLNDYLEFEKINLGSSYLLTYERIAKKQFHISKASNNGRIYHNLTGINSEWLKYIKFKDQENIIELDIKNSQPLIYSLFLNNYISNNKSSYFENDEFSNKLIKDILTPLLCSSEFNTDDLYNEIALFTEMCQKGILYDYYECKLKELQDFEVHFQKSGKSEMRDFAKKCFIEVLFGKYNHSNSFAKIGFKIIFPMVCKVFDALKERLFNFFQSYSHLVPHEFRLKYFSSKAKGEKKPYDVGNDFLSVYLQNIESYIFIENLLPQLLRANLTVLPKHDAILCKSSENEKVSAIMHQVLTQFFGAGKYQFKTKVLKEEDVQILELNVSTRLTTPSILIP